MIVSARHRHTLLTAIAMLVAACGIARAASLPTVTNSTASGVTDTAATLGGSVTSDGGATITVCGVVFAPASINNNPQIGGTGVTNMTVTGTTGIFSGNVSSLTPGTIYSYAPYATNSVGTAYGVASTFSTLTSFSYSTSGGNLTITGYTGSGGAVSIPSTIYGLPITGIGSQAFYSNWYLSSITIPVGVTSIGSQAFYNCINLTSITIPSSVTSIGSQAFNSCTDLTSISIPPSVTSIGSQAFFECMHMTSIAVDSHNATYSSLNGVLYDKLQTTIIEYPGGNSGSFTIPSSVTSIGTYAFSACFYLTGVTIPASVTSVGDYAFLYCFGLTAITVDSLNANFSSSNGVLFNKNQTTLIQYPGGKSGSFTIPSSVTSIGVSAFDSCDSLTSINIPSSVTSIGSHAFYNCTTLTTISVNSTNPSYSSVNGMLFDKNQTTVIQCPGGITGSVTIPFGVTSISSDAFLFCRDLTNVTIPSSVTSIGDFAFFNCASLTSITIPASVTSIGQAAFVGCQDLLSVYFLGNSPPIGYGVFDLSQAPTRVYYFNDKTGFPWPTWIAYNRMVNMGNSNPATIWLLSNNLRFNANLQSDPNGDGVSLLMAYALNLDPRQNLGGSMPQPVIAGNQMSLTFYAGSAGVTYSVESSTDLQTWSTADVTLSDPDANNFRTATVNQDGPNKFLRVVANY